MPSRSLSENFAPGHARKISCAACGLVNLDRFVSFPFCAACGARLPQISAPGWLEIWKKPVPILLWAVPVGVGILILATLTFGIAHDRRDSSLGLLSVPARIPQKGVIGSTLIFRFEPEPVENAKGASLQNVRLRLSATLTRNFWVVGLSPTPQKRQTQGSGLYFFWPQLRAGQNLILRLRPKKTGRFATQFGVYAQNYEGFETRRTIIIGP